MILTMEHPNGTPIIVDTEDFPLITAHCTRCKELIVADERGPAVEEFVKVLTKATADHQCKNLS